MQVSGKSRPFACICGRNSSFCVKGFIRTFQAGYPGPNQDLVRNYTYADLVMPSCLDFSQTAYYGQKCLA